MPEAPAATSDLSSTSACSPAAARCQAVDSPWTPAPITRWRAESGSAGIRADGSGPRSGSSGSVIRRLPALEHRRTPVGPDGPRPVHPRAQLGLGELRVRPFQPDSVGVAGGEVGDQHLARDLVLAAL